MTTYSRINEKSLARHTHKVAEEYAAKRSTRHTAVATVLFSKDKNGNISLQFCGHVSEAANHPDLGGAMVAFLEGGRKTFNDWKKENNDT